MEGSLVILESAGGHKKSRQETGSLFGIVWTLGLQIKRIPSSARGFGNRKTKSNNGWTR
jgi:hypothetical protein